MITPACRRSRCRKSPLSQPKAACWAERMVSGPRSRRLGMTARPIPRRHWRSYGDEPLPTGTEALDEPFRAFPSWFMRITCDRCGKDRMLNEAHMKRSDAPIRDIIAGMRHDGCGGRAGRWSCRGTNRRPSRAQRRHIRWPKRGCHTGPPWRGATHRAGASPRLGALRSAPRAPGRARPR